MRHKLQVTIALSILLATLQARGQEGQPIRVDAFDIAMGSTVSSLRLSPNGTIRVTGTVTYGPDGTVWDAATVQPPDGRRRDGGLIDAEASGLTLRDRDAESHTYTYAAAGSPSEVCRSVGQASPCLVLRLPAIAASRRRDLGELREELAGGLRAEVLMSTTPAVSPAQPLVVPDTPYTGDGDSTGDGWFWMAAAGATGGGLVLSLAALFVVARRRRRGGTPVARAQASARRLRKELSGDPVKARLLKVVDDLAQESLALEKVELQLRRAVEDAKPEELERRHEKLERTAAGLAERGGDEAGAGELRDAADIVEGQLDRCRRWEMQRWRSAARMERIATRLEALEAELKDPAQGKIEEADELMDLLQEELELARAGEEEAQRLLGSGKARAA